MKTVRPEKNSLFKEMFLPAVIPNPAPLSYATPI